MAKGRRRRGDDHEEHVNHERWLLTYADMITLLMVLFIVMFAMSTVDSKKFQELKQSLAGAFGGSTSPISGGATQGGDTDGISPAPLDLQAGGAGAGAGAAGSAAGADNHPAAVAAASTESSKLAAEAAAKAVQQADLVKAYQNQKAAAAEAATLQQAQQQMTDQLRAAGLQDSVQFSVDDRGLVVNVVTNSLVFGGDSAVLLAAGQRILAALAPALAALPNRLEIAGHTNQLAVPTVNYPSSWELSTARASSVVRYLLSLPGLSPNRMTATGYADQRPLVPPSDPVSVVRNRRVEVIVLSDKPADVRALLAAVSGSN